MRKIISQNVGIQVFMAFWAILDLIFRFIETLFVSIFDAIPVEAIPFLIGIFCYSVLSFFVFFINTSNENSQRLLLKGFYAMFIVLMILFSVWRLGFIVMLDVMDAEASFSSFAIFFVNIVYVIVAIIILVSFYKKITWLKTLLIVVLWMLFLLLTFIIVPAMEWQVQGTTVNFTTISSATLMQVFFVAAIFVVPRGLNKFKKAKESGVECQ